MRSRGREERRLAGGMEGEEREGGTADHCSKGIPRLERGVAPRIASLPLHLPPSLHPLLTHAES